MGSPMADHREKRPPTQSHISKMLSLPTPKATAFSTLEDTAIKCRLVVLSLPPLFKNHVRAVLAFSVVSGVVKLLDATTNKDRKSTRLNSSHVAISYAVFCLKNKKK